MILSNENFLSVFERLRPYFKKHELTWVSRLQDWVGNETTSFNLDDYMKGLADLSLANFKAEVNFLVKFCREFVEVSPFQVRFWLGLKTCGGIKFIKRIPTNAEIRNNLPKLAAIEQVFLAIMVSSGRRAADVRRIKSSSTEISENEVSVTVERDKTYGIKLTQCR